MDGNLMEVSGWSPHSVNLLLLIEAKISPKSLETGEVCNI